MIRAITFDFWNTLYKGPADRRVFDKRIKAVTQLLQQAGYDLSSEVVGVAFKAAWQKADRMQLEQYFDPTPRGQIEFALQDLQLQVDEHIKDELYQAYTSKLLEIPPDMNDGVAETLPLLAEKHRLAVICNTGVTPGVILRQLMKKDKIFDYFQFLVFSDEVAWAKPNAAIFKYTLENIQMTSQQAAHIGDNEHTDVAGAKAAGMTTVWLAPDKTYTVPEADYHVQSVRELLNLF
ncbi:2-haloalkanoic acid dehalogenase-related [hydrocarbon metagenome]|uniref:2-haloalkanoic acid dehalogenase-related n=1 Tax=hydrocarbon metagenome TaxID=938273 RepID=A0A0W8E3L8_9ZZZZ